MGFCWPPPPHWTITPVRETVPLILKVSVNEFPLVLSEAVHVPTMSPAVPLERVHVILSLAHAMVVAVIVTPVGGFGSGPDVVGPSHVKSVLVQLNAITPVVEFHVYVPLALCVPVPAPPEVEKLVRWTFEMRSSSI
jgi:hypothetical protein